jgi:hypothetical protein
MYGKGLTETSKGALIELMLVAETAKVIVVVDSNSCAACHADP